MSTKNPTERNLDCFILGFSYNIWRIGKKISTAGLSNNNLAQLMQDLGLSQFVYKDDKRCSNMKSPFFGATDNWINGKRMFAKSILSIKVNRVKILSIY